MASSTSEMLPNWDKYLFCADCDDMFPECIVAPRRVYCKDCFAKRYVIWKTHGKSASRQWFWKQSEERKRQIREKDRIRKQLKKGYIDMDGFRFKIDLVKDTAAAAAATVVPATDDVTELV